MLTRATLRRVATMLVGGLLFAQAALAWSACTGLERAPQRAFEQEPECHRAADAPNRNLCLMHCTGDQQSLDKPGVTLPPLADAPVLVVDRPFARNSFAGVVPHDVSSIAQAPPPRILFGVMRT